MKNRMIKYGKAIGLAAVVLLAQMQSTVVTYADPGQTPTQIVIDGNDSEWAGIGANGQNQIQWKAAYSSDKSILYFTYSGTASTQWDYNYLGNNKMTISYANNNDNKYTMLQFAWDGSKTTVKDAWYGDIPGAQAVTVNEANHNTAGPYTVEASISVSSLPDTIETITFDGITLTAAQIPVLGLNETETQPSEPQQPESQETETMEPETQQPDSQEPETTEPESQKPEAVYNGITIDGQFDDWNAVEKTEMSNPNPGNPDVLSEAAMVFDGDYVYIYIEEGKGQNAAWAGTHGNGKFEIKTDINRELLFQLKEDGTISGVEGATAMHVGRQWEIAIPASQLPKYRKTISFGLYNSDMTITDVANLKEDNHIVDSNTDIAYDGQFGDWDYYPLTHIDYATAGTQENVADAAGALYYNDGVLFGYAETSMEQHLQQAGHGFTTGVTVYFGENGSLEQRLATVDASGNINWQPSLRNLPDGDYEYYIFDTSAWGNSSNINELNDHDICYGRMTVHIDGVKDQCEFYMELEQVAKKLNCDASEFKKIDAKFINLGNELVTTAGTSSGPWTGIAISTLSVGIIWFSRKKKGVGLS